MFFTKKRGPKTSGYTVIETYGLSILMVRKFTSENELIKNISGYVWPQPPSISIPPIQIEKTVIGRLIQNNISRYLVHPSATKKSSSP